MPKTIKLSRRYEAHGKVFDAVTLRDPKLRDYFEVGEPTEVQPTGQAGGVVLIEYFDKIDAYLSRLLQEPLSSADLIDLDLSDAILLKDAITGFFTEAKRLRRAPTSSSGVEAGALQRSAG